MMPILPVSHFSSRQSGMPRNNSRQAPRVKALGNLDVPFYRFFSFSRMIAGRFRQSPFSPLHGSPPMVTAHFEKSRRPIPSRSILAQPLFSKNSRKIDIFREGSEFFVIY
jgi:hypothetical protein